MLNYYFIGFSYIDLNQLNIKQQIVLYQFIASLFYFCETQKHRERLFYVDH